jgi:hypothetical protein
MRHTWLAPLALAATVGACGSPGGEASAGEAAAMDADTVTAMSMLSQPACEPSGNMELEGRSSPYDSTTIEVGEGVAKLCYGRPSLRGRTMIGGDAVPYDTLWRTGANEPSTIHLNVPATIAGLDVEAGSYSLYTVPRQGEEWTLIVNRSTSQWGHESRYTQEVREQEVGRVPVRHEAIDPAIEQLTFRPMEGGSGLVLEWQNSRVHIPIEPRS